MTLLAVDLGASEGRDHVGASRCRGSPVQDPEPSACCVARDCRWYASEPASGSVSAKARALPGQVRQEALLLLVRPEQEIPEPDRLVDAEHDRVGRVDLSDRLEDPGISRLGEPLAAVLGLIGARAPISPRSAMHLVGIQRSSSTFRRRSSRRSSPGSARSARDPRLLIGFGRGPGRRALVNLAAEQGLTGMRRRPPLPPPPSGSLP